METAANDITDFTFDFDSFTLNLEEDFLPLVGVVIKKYFPKSFYGEAGWFMGKVVYFHYPFYHVLYKDGDEEDMTKEEVMAYAIE
jgi:hypothetical protein